MKKIIFLAAALVISAAAFSQTSFGLKSGLSLANLTNSEGEAKFKPSIYAGGFMEFSLNYIISVSPELYYSRQGFHAEEDDVKMNLRLNYMNLPVLVKLYVADNLSLDLGPQVGFLLNSKVWVKSGGVSATMDVPNEYMPVELNSVDVSFAMGLTYNLGNFFLQGRYNLGLTDIAKDDPDHSKNSVIQFGVGYRF